MSVPRAPDPSVSDPSDSVASRDANTKGVNNLKLCIADPPYPPMFGSGGRKNRASRWYGDKQRAASDRPSDNHRAAAEWDEPKRHLELLDQLMTGYDGWALATSVDGMAAYGALPTACKVMAWIKPNAQPGSHRIAARWEPVIVYPPVGRRSNRNGRGMVSNVLTAPVPGKFIGAKPEAWTHWVLDALTYDPSTDHVEDLFRGSGMVSAAVETYRAAK